MTSIFMMVEWDHDGKIKDLILCTCTQHQPIYHSYVLNVNKMIWSLTRLITQMSYTNLTYQPE